MKVLKKMSFEALVGAMSREAMKEFIAGSGSTMSGSGGSSYNNLGGGGMAGAYIDSYNTKTVKSFLQV